MDTVKYIKSFSKGQITIPKELRNEFGLGDEFWLKLSVEKGRIIAEPLESKQDKEEYKKKLLKIKQIFIDTEELAGNRVQLEKQLKTRSL